MALTIDKDYDIIKLGMSKKSMNGGNMFKWSLLSKYRNEIFGISIISIIIFHFFEDVGSYGQGFFSPAGSLYNDILGSVGVELFVFLSGMGLYFSFRKNNDVRLFFQKRLKRILPAYLLWGFLFWWVRDIAILKAGIKNFIYDYSLLSFWGRGTKSLWFIAFILLMYLLFPFFYYWFEGSEKKRILKLILLILLLHLGFKGIKYCMPGFYGNTEIALLRIYSFLLGVYCSKYVYEKKDGGIWMYLLIGSGLVIQIISLVLHQDIPAGVLNKRIVMCLFSISLLFLVAKCLDLIRCRNFNDLMTQAGAYSLELYMTHVSIRHIMNRIGMKTYKIENYLICILLSVLCSMLLQKLITTMTNRQIHGKID